MEKKTVTVSIDLPNDLYEEIVREAGGSRRRIGALLLARYKAGRKPRSSKKPRADGESRLNPQIKKSAKQWRVAGLSPGLMKYIGAFKGGEPYGGDNEKIDADLQRELMNNHEDEK